MATRKKAKTKAKTKAKRRPATAARPVARKKTAKRAKKPVKKAPVRRAPTAKAKPAARPAAKPARAPAKPAAAKPAAPSAPAPAAPPAQPEGERVGVVTHYYGHLSVAAVRLETGRLRVGDRIRIHGHTSDFTQRVESLQIEHRSVTEVGPNDDFALKVIEHAREHDVVYKLAP